MANPVLLPMMLALLSGSTGDREKEMRGREELISSAPTADRDQRWRALFHHHPLRGQSQSDANTGLPIATPELASSLDSLVAGYAKHRFKIPEDVALAVRRTETGSSATPWAISDAGAIGMMQVMPLHTDYAEQLTGSRDLSDPSTNAITGLAVLKDLKRRYGTWERAIQAYNGSLGKPSGKEYYNTFMKNLADVRTAMRQNVKKRKVEE